MAKLILNKKDFLEYINNLKDPNAQGKALGLTLGTTIAGGTIGALTGEVLGNPFGGATVGAALGGAAGAYKSKKYFTEASKVFKISKKLIEAADKQNKRLGADHQTAIKNKEKLKEIFSKKLNDPKTVLTEASENKPEKSHNVPCKGIKEKKGFSCKEELFRGKPTGKFFISTHRARSKNYDSFDKIPQSVINFIDSTG
jgi:hypothetical protein